MKISNLIKLNIIFSIISIGTINATPKIHYYEQHHLPIIDVAIDFQQIPQFYEPALAELTANLLNKGSKNITENDLAQQLADLGIELSIGQDEERVKIRLRTLTKNWQKAIELLNKLLEDPLFLDDVVQREKTRLLANWKEAQTEPETVLETAQNPYIFGNIKENPRFPLNQLLTEENIKTVSSTALKNYYQQNYCLPQVVMIGDMQRNYQQDILKILTQNLSFCNTKKITGIKNDATNTNTTTFSTNSAWDWENIPLKTVKEQQNIQKIKHHATQSHIRLIQPSVQRTHQDYFPLLVANHILGGNGFNSRLMKEVRENRGLTYGIYSSVQPYREGGLLQIYLRTAKKNTEQALKVTLDTWKNLATGKDLSNAEIDFAKNQLIASFPLKLDTQKKKLEQLTSQNFYDLPDNYLQQWQKNVQNVNKKQLLDVMKKYWLNQPYHIAYLID